MRKWRVLSQSETDLCWKNFVERVEEEVLHKCKVEDSKREAFRGRGALLGMEEGAQKQETQNEKVWIDCWAMIFSLFGWRIQLAASAKQRGGVNRRRGDEAAAKNGYLMKNITGSTV